MKSAIFLCRAIGEQTFHDADNADKSFSISINIFMEATSFYPTGNQFEELISQQFMHKS